MQFIQKLRNLSVKGEDEGTAGPLKVTIIGSGNWGSTAAKIVATNTARSENFVTDVNMWVYEETVRNGEKLSEIINCEHENIKYLPGVKLPENVKAVTDLAEACKDSNVLVFVVPHQFLTKLLPDIKNSMAKNAFGISLIKGIDFDSNGIVLLSDVIRKELKIDVSVLMGANVAQEIANEEFAEATIGATQKHAKTFKKLFQTPYFRIQTVSNPRAVELCGALKNVVALGAGFSDGLGLGNNTKAAIIRIGLIEMAKIIEQVTGEFPTEILVESCGVADLITTCYGGRNRKCAEAFVRNPEKGWDAIEKEMLNGQSLQGTLTCLELNKVLETYGENMKEKYPLFKNIYDIAFQGAPASSIVEGLVAEEELGEI